MADFDLLGKPCVGARYTGGGDAHELLEGALCPVCHRYASQCHHWPAKGMGGSTFTLETPNGFFRLRSPLFAVCGFGNAGGCHGLWHRGRVRAEWVWDSDFHARAWAYGEFPAELYRNDPRLFRYGHYRLDNFDGKQLHYNALHIRSAEGRTHENYYI